MSMPYAGDIDDESGPIWPMWYSRGATAQNTVNPLTRDQYNIPAPVNPQQALNFPSDQLYVVINQQYNDPDSNPLGGYLTFWPSSAFTVTDSGSSWRVLQRLVGTATWPYVDAGVSPWAFSMEDTGKIYIYQGLLIVKLFATENPGLVTDDGNPLTYHVTEHFLGGQQFDISVPGASAPGVSLYSLAVAGTIRPFKYDPVNPLGTPGAGLEAPEDTLSPFTWTQSHLSTQFIQATIGAAVNPTGNTVQMAFPAQNVDPVSGDWVPAVWVSTSAPYICQSMVGPGEAGVVALAAGNYDIWVQITSGAEDVIFQAGSAVIT